MPTCVVTGAAGGIGSATCALLETRGWTVIPLDRRPIEHQNAIQVDLADADGVVAALEGLGSVHGLVNNAAMQLFKPLLDTSVDEWDLVAAVNIRAAFVCTRTLALRLQATGGAIVNVASVHAEATSRSIAAYAATKGGLMAFTRAAALELAPLGVRVNAILPGAIDTPALRDGFTRRPNAERDLINSTPLKKVGHPSEVAEAIHFLLDGERASFVTGQGLTVDGGVLARLASE